MKSFLKTYWKTLLFFTAIGLIVGFFTGLYALDTYPAEIRRQILEQGLTVPILGLISAVQSAGYGLVLGAFGILLGKKTGLWKDERAIAKKPLTIAILISLVGGFALIVPDLLFFGQYSDVIRDSYAVKPSIVFILASITYGAVIEEVMLRLFVLSLFAFLLHKLFGKKHDGPTTAILMVSNILAALLFAVGHLPATLMTLGSAPVIIFRCLLLNGVFGLAFGYLYRKHGLRYAMIAHGGCHIVSKLIWILFV